MSWLLALKEYSKLSGKYFVPKKGTPEYDAVKKIQDKMAGVVEKVPEVKKPVKKVEAVIEAPVKDAVKERTKEEYHEQKIKPRIEKLKKLAVEAQEAEDKKKVLREKYDAQEKAVKKARNAKPSQEDIDAQKALLKSKEEAHKAEALALRTQIEANEKKARARKSAVAEVPAPVEAPPAPKGRKPRAKKVSMTIEEKPVVLEFK